MAEKWVRPYNPSGYGTNSGNDYANAINGLADLVANYLTKSAQGDTINFVGTFTAATDYNDARFGRDSKDRPTLVNADGALGYLGLTIGSATASVVLDRTFQFLTPYGQAILDPRGSTLRFRYTFMARGYKARVLNCVAYNNDYDFGRWVEGSYPGSYSTDGSIPSYSAVFSVPPENVALGIFGARTTLRGCITISNQYGSGALVWGGENNGGGRRSHNSFVEDNVFESSAWGIRCSSNGQKWLRDNCRLFVRRNRITQFADFRYGSTQVNMVYFSMAGAYLFSKNVIDAAYGQVQDLADFAICPGGLIIDNDWIGSHLRQGFYAHSTVSPLSGDGALGTRVWSNPVRTGTSGSNGIKLGLTIGTANYPVDYLRAGSSHRVSRNRISYCLQAITVNGGKGSDGLTPAGMSFIDHNLLMYNRTNGIYVNWGGFALLNNTIIRHGISAPNSFVAAIYFTTAEIANNCVVHNNILHIESGSLAIGLRMDGGASLTANAGGNNIVADNKTISGATYTPSVADTTLSLADLGIDPNTGRPTSSAAPALTMGTRFGGPRLDLDQKLWPVGAAGIGAISTP